MKERDRLRRIVELAADVARKATDAEAAMREAESEIRAMPHGPDREAVWQKFDEARTEFYATLRMKPPQPPVLPSRSALLFEASRLEQQAQLCARSGQTKRAGILRDEAAELHKRAKTAKDDYHL